MQDISLLYIGRREEGGGREEGRRREEGGKWIKGGGKGEGKVCRKEKRE